MRQGRKQKAECRKQKLGEEATERASAACREAGCQFACEYDTVAEMIEVMTRHMMSAHLDEKNLWPNRMDWSEYDKRFLKGLRILAV